MSGISIPYYTILYYAILYCPEVQILLFGSSRRFVYWPVGHPLDLQPELPACKLRKTCWAVFKIVGALFVGVLLTRGLRFRVYIKAPDFGHSHFAGGWERKFQNLFWVDRSPLVPSGGFHSPSQNNPDPDPWADPKSRSTLGCYNLHHRGFYFLDPPRGLRNHQLLKYSQARQAPDSYGWK